jgi:hypothetical protein
MAERADAKRNRPTPRPRATDPTPAAHDRRHVVGSPLHDQWLLDEALAETFPASDPISPSRATLVLKR